MIKRRIKKIAQTTPIQAEVIDSLDGNSTTDAPSVNAVKKIFDKFDWLLVGKTTGTTKLQLPETFNELYVETNVNEVNLLFNIPRATLSTTEKPFYNGYYFVAENSRAVMIQATTTQIHLSVAYDNLGDKTGTSTMTVYYR